MMRRASKGLLHDPSIQLIVVECRAWEAVPWGRKVIDAGKHLHLEKPPGNEWAAFQEMMSEARLGISRTVGLLMALA